MILLSSALEQKLNWLKQTGHFELLSQLLHGIEKEGLRVDEQCRLAQTPHPKALGSALTHAHITTDYSEALLEFITPVFEKSSDALGFLADLHRFTYQKLGDEQIWPASMPCLLPEEKDIPIARYGSSNVGQMKYIYRVGLEHRYGKAMQTIAGIHYNFSLPEAFWPAYHAQCQSDESLQDFRSAAYFCLIRNFRRYSWLLIYLFGASPTLCDSFLKDKKHNLEEMGNGTLYLPYATSLRMSDLGYSNKAQEGLNICFNHLDTYAKSLEGAIRTPYEPYDDIGVKVDGEYRQLNTNILQIENEYYSDIRPKRVTESGEKPIHALMHRGVEYIEVRNTDINPFLPLGIDQAQADFLDLFLVNCLLSDDRDISSAECEQIQSNHQLVVNRGREPGLALNKQGQMVSLQQWGLELLAELEETAALFDQAHQSDRFSQTVQQQKEKLLDPALTPSAQVLATMQEEGLNHGQFIIRQAQKHKESLLAEASSADMEAMLVQMSQDSLSEQQQIESAEQPSFDAYLADYMAH